jgi:chaperonin GroEL|tara:strand:+ start:341 stop:1969 length:1629 start_codon:yes stop_codon:yes gene_type:complete
MSKIIEFGPEARKQLVEGIDTIANAVVSTLGPNGRNVVISKPNDYPQSTKDGVTVAKNISLEDPIQELGVQMLKQAAIKTADNAGDGTTTSTLLAREIVKAGLEQLDNGANAVDIKRGIDAAVKQVISQLRSINEEVSSPEQLEQIATISANNDNTIGKLIATAMEKVGREGVVHIEESKTGETYLETVEGMQFDRGFKSPYFVTNNNTMTSTLNDAYVLVADHTFTSVKELLPILEGVSNTNKSLLIIAKDIDNEALATLIVNKMRGTLKVCAVKAPDFGDRQKLVLDDIATLTGGQVFSKEKGMKIEKFSWEWFGEARVATITKEKTTIVDGKGSEEAISQRVEELATQIENAQTPFEIERLQDRMSKFVGGVSIVHVGGNTETEMNEKKDRVDDALNATKAAIEEGILPGGGVALLGAVFGLELSGNKDFEFGASIVQKACRKPFNQILTNAGYTQEEANLISLDVEDLDWVGYNIKTNKTTNLKEAGIIDPFKVTRSALQNAASIAGTILLTECTIVDKPSENNMNELDPSALMGGMM